MRVFVSGGAGFIGSHLVDGLLSAGHRVVALDDLSSGNRENVSQHLTYDDFELIRGDVTNAESVDSVLEKGYDVVFHLAARISNERALRKPRDTNDVNVAGTLNLLHSSSKSGVERLVLASSAAVYGEQKPPLTEDSPLRPKGVYGASKAAAEAYCTAYQETIGLDVVVLRFLNVYGPRARGGRYSGVMTNFASRLLEGEPPKVYGDGEQTRDFVSVHDVVRGCISAMENDDAVGEAINLGTGVPTSVNELAEVFIELAGADVEPEHVDARPGEVRHSHADTQKARRLLGFEPEVELREGVRRFLEWFRDTTRG